MPRKEQALRPPEEPAASYRGFPRRTFRAGAGWFRQHLERPGPDRGAWWFASREEGHEGAGRFDLVHPDGTCYLANTPLAALNELVGPETARRGWVDAALLAGRVISRLELPDDVRAADTTKARAALFRVTNELGTTEDYDTTQAWAAVWRAAGFGAVLAVLRFTPGRARSLALFGQAGAPAPPPPGDPEPTPVRAVAEQHRIRVVDAPTRAGVEVVPPPT